MVSFFILGCQVADPIVVPINNTAKNINSSSTLYKDDSTHTKVGLNSDGLVWKREF
jgi:hypothetical protein